MAYSSDSWVCCLTVSTHSCSETRAVKLRPDAVPEFVGEIYDLALNRPEHLRMITWAQLEGFTPDEPDADGQPIHAHGIAAIEAAQAAGHVDPAWQPADLIVLLFATGLAWAHLPHPDAVTDDPAVAAVHERPDLELVGTLVYSDAKAGRDVGDVCGIGPVGVTATTDPDEIVALDADCVLYMPQGEMNPMGALDDICRLLGSGKNVVSTAVTGLIYPRSLGDKVVDRLESACATGQTSFHATGIEPGWAAEVLPLTMSGLFQRIDSLLVKELMDYTSYDSADMLFDIMGFGKAPDEPVPMADAALAGVTFRAPLMLLADGLDATIDDFVYHREVAVAAEAFDIKAGRVEARSVAAQRFGYTAIVAGRRALTVEHITRLGDEQAPNWPTGRGWKVTVEGRPSMVLDSKIATHGEDETDQGCLGTAMHAVHAIAPVCAAAPGIRTFLDLPMITGRGVLGVNIAQR